MGKKKTYGLFVYETSSDTLIKSRFFTSKSNAIKEAKLVGIKNDEDPLHIEVVKKEKDGSWSTKPIFKLDFT
ncbi:MAG: hypothetical protein KKD01_19860 [Proteobacteria bacterium]|nr:hypothetical protein [Pseudomonadota bacterium]MBU1456977.1 hypothetical protein [Pseudomonadota bacterium]